MKRLIRIIALLTLLFLQASCQRAEVLRPSEANESKLEIVLNIPRPALTRADEGYLPAEDPELTIHTVQIWVFRHDTGARIAYLNLDSNNLASGVEQRYSVVLPEAIARSAPNVDLYAIANAAATGLTFEETTTRATLAGYCLEGDRFGVSTLTGRSDITATGLPFAGMLEDTPMTGSYPVLKISTVTLTRAVSKIRVILCRQEGETQDDFHFDSVNISGNIGKKEKLFTDNVFDAGRLDTGIFELDESDGKYVTLNEDITIPATVATCPGPGEFGYRPDNHPTETPAEYEARLDAGVAAGDINEVFLAYLRESDAKLTGRIGYHIGSEATQYVEFTMESAGDFIRNHVWVVYAYFIGGDLYVRPVRIPWTAGHAPLEVSTSGAVTMAFDWVLQYDENGDSGDWDDVHVAVAYGYYSGSKRPKYSRIIELSTDYPSSTLHLNINNPLFRFILVDGDESLGSSYSEAGTTLTIQPGERVTRFCVVPTSSEAPSGAQAFTSITLVESKQLLREIIGEDPDGNPIVTGTELVDIIELVPFNHELPGSEDHTLLYYYNCGSYNYETWELNTEANRPATGDGHHYWRYGPHAND